MSDSERYNAVSVHFCMQTEFDLPLHAALALAGYNAVLSYMYDLSLFLFSNLDLG